MRSCCTTPYSRRTRILADEFVLLDVVGFLADRLAGQREDMATRERSALIELSALEFGLWVEVVADQAAAVGFQPGRRNRLASLAVERMILRLHWARLK